MIDFPEDYFKTEIRDGFEITSMMKRAWAGQMEVLQTMKMMNEDNVRETTLFPRDLSRLEP